MNLNPSHNNNSNQDLNELSQKILSNPSLIASYIDHTLLKPEAQQKQIDQICLEAEQNKFKAICVNSSYLTHAKSKLSNSNVLVAVVVGFPLGACSTKVKALEADFCRENGANEIDMVLSIGALKDLNYKYVESDIREVVKASGLCTKVIFETSLLTPEEIKTACKISEQAGAHFVKTSTGFGGRGASLEDIQIMKQNISKHVQVKASGGIRDLKWACQLIAAGADRLGTSSGVALVQNTSGQQSY